eukprot:gene16949-biopygen9798
MRRGRGARQGLTGSRNGEWVRKGREGRGAGVPQRRHGGGHGGEGKGAGMQRKGHGGMNTAGRDSAGEDTAGKGGAPGKEEAPARQDAARQDAARQDAARQDAARQDAARQDAGGDGRPAARHPRRRRRQRSLRRTSQPGPGSPPGALHASQPMEQRRVASSCAGPAAGTHCLGGGPAGSDTELRQQSGAPLAPALALGNPLASISSSDSLEIPRKFY